MGRQLNSTRVVQRHLEFMSQSQATFVVQFLRYQYIQMNQSEVLRPLPGCGVRTLRFKWNYHGFMLDCALFLTVADRDWIKEAIFNFTVSQPVV